MSLYDKIREADDIADTLVDVPEWGVAILVRSPNGRERAELLNLIVSEDSDERRALLFPMTIALTAHDPDTKERLFTREDVAWLAEKNGVVLQRVAEVGMRLAGLVADAVEEGKGGSSETPTAGTDSGSPNDSE